MLFSKAFAHTVLSMEWNRKYWEWNSAVYTEKPLVKQKICAHRGQPSLLKSKHPV